MTLKKPQYPPECDKLVLSRSRSPKRTLSSSLTRRDFLARSAAALSVSPFVFTSPNTPASRSSVLFEQRRCRARDAAM